MDFDQRLEVALEALPKWRRMRVARKRRNQLADPVSKVAVEPQPDPIKLPAGSFKQYQEHKQAIMDSLGTIASINPSLKPAIENALDMLFRDVTVHIVEGMAGESWEVLQREWLRVQKNINNIRALIPPGPQFRVLRNNLRKFRDTLSREVGSKIFHNPMGPRPKSFSAE